MSGEEAKIAFEGITEYGVLGSLVIFLFLSWRSTIARLFKLIENNTEVVTTNSNLLKEVKKALDKR